MTDQEYLDAILHAQDLKDDSDELTALRGHRNDVEELLRESFPDSAPTIRYGGSIAKGTLIKKSYDLDMICYFPNDDTTAGETLKDIYYNTKKVLATKYPVEEKTSAIRLRSSTTDLHIDVVPGRFTDDTKTDAFLYQAGADKERLKTNLQVHIDHVKHSGVIPAIRLMKLWRVTYAITDVKNFALELLTIKLLNGKKKQSLSNQLIAVWTSLQDEMDSLTIEDPANPNGNDLSNLLNFGARLHLCTVARATIMGLDKAGWKQIFPAEGPTGDERKEALHRAAAVITSPTKPWCA